ncbi:LamG domain-containing protein [Solirubrobacter ginsenosidimutans]|uniref:LamG domain-containing protein n=1 Tax=Solirubrobacter ginsenosidimutans TaxID=490573 RepID=A0A9X3S3U4_9ACTN|nr:LamG domain-containing protein [Solirubrobacter ginsenosidimutans]MDA0166095.1 LamG domain-containing protein [Solirubrobacter ginsenosidimutans]
MTAAAAAVGTSPAAASEQGLVAQWNFDEGTGQVVHDSGPFGLDATLGLTAQADAADPVRIAGASGGALHFDGTTFVRLPDTPKLAVQHLTIEATARANGSPGSYRYLVARGGSKCVSASYGLYTAPNGGLAFYVFDGSRYVLSATARRKDVWDGKWHNLTGSFDGAALRLFVDGREVGEPMAAPLRISYAIPSSNALIGQYGGECDLGFTGDIDSVSIRSDAGTPGPTPESPTPPSLPAAAPGTTLPAAEPPPVPTRPTDPKPTASTCAVRLSRATIVAGRRTIIRARLVHAPKHRKLRVSARRGSSRKAVATARLNRAGSARLVLRAQRVGHLTVHVTGCASAQLRIRK